MYERRLARAVEKGIRNAERKRNSPLHRFTQRMTRYVLRAWIFGMILLALLFGMSEAFSGRH